MNKLKNNSKDRNYFVLTPMLVWALCDNVYEKSLWDTVKMTAGEDGECILSTQDLATLSMMSHGKVCECRKSLIEKGLLHGEFRRDPGYPQPIWHLTIPDLWEQNIEMMKKLPKIKDKLKFKQEKSRHHMTPKEPSPHDGGVSPHDGGVSPHDGGVSPHDAILDSIIDCNLDRRGEQPAPASRKFENKKNGKKEVNNESSDSDTYKDSISVFDSFYSKFESAWRVKARFSLPHFFKVELRKMNKDVDMKYLFKLWEFYLSCPNKKFTSGWRPFVDENTRNIIAKYFDSGQSASLLFAEKKNGKYQTGLERVFA